MIPYNMMNMLVKTSCLRLTLRLGKLPKNTPLDSFKDLCSTKILLKVTFSEYCVDCFSCRN